MNDVRIFNNPDFGNIRTAKIDGKDYFCGNDVASALKYSSPKNAVSRHCKGALFWCPDGEQQEMKYIPEGDMYRLIIKASSQSNSEEVRGVAEKFEEWIFDEVLPQLRQTGSYNVPKTIPEQIQLLAQGNVELNQRVDNLSERMDKIELDLPILPIEADRITEAVRRKGVAEMGGKQSAAYQNRGLRQKVYNNIYSNLKYNFAVRSYKAIKRSQCDRAIEIVNAWKPPVFLSDEISGANAQISLDL